MVDTSTGIFWLSGILIAIGLLVVLFRNNILAYIFWLEYFQEPVTNFIMSDNKELRILSYVKQNATKGDTQSVLNSIDKYCRQTEWAMNVGDEKGLILDKLVLEADPKICLELGAYCGYSAVRISRLLKPGSRFISIELSPTRADIARQMVEFAGVQDMVQFVIGPSQEVIPQLKKKCDVDTFDFVFIDHIKTRYLQDTKLLEEADLLRKGSVLVADNVICPGAPDFLQYVRTSGRYDCTNYPSHVEYTTEEDALEKAVFRG